MRGSVSFAAQGGSTSGCGVPSGASAVEVSVSSVAPTGASGFLRVFPAGSSVSATFVSYTAGRGITNTGTVGLNTAVTNDLGVSNAGGSTHVVIDIQGYFAPSGGASYVPLASPCRVVDTRGGGGVLARSGSRAFQVAGTGSVFASQGGTSGGCGVPDGVPGVEATVSVVAPTGANGFVRVAPNNGSVPTATFLNYTTRTGITNTGSITLSNTEVRDVSVRNFGGTTHVVIDVQGYYTTAAGQGSRYQTVTPCRAVDTRSAGGALAAGRTRVFQIAGERVGYARQGAQSVTGCGVPQRAAAVEASLTAVAPTGTGFTRPGPAGSVASGTFLNYTSVGSITNTGTLPLALGGDADLGVTNLGGSASYVVDVYGYYEPSPVFPRSAETISAGVQHTCMIVGGATEVRCWGANDNGQLGNGTTDSRPTPAPASGLSGVVQVVAGFGDSCALLTGGTVSCWGGSDETAVSGLTGVTQLSAGDSHICAVLIGGSVSCWGDNTFGQIGDGSTEDRLTPTAVSGLSGVVQVTAGFRHTCAVLVGGAVRCWGLNNSGQLGDGTTTNRLTATPVSGLSGAAQVTAGWEHTCAVLVDGTARCWGEGGIGQLGDGSATDRLTPTAVSGLSGVAQIDAGSGHTCALLVGGAVRCWGDNMSGQIGVGTDTLLHYTPTAVAGLAGAVQVTAGFGHTCAVLAGGTARCWGSNFGGKLGDATTVNRFVPTAVAGLSGVVQVSAGAEHTCAVLADGTVRCWGGGLFGKVGTDALRNLVPTPVAGVAGAVQIATGANHTCVLLFDGTARCWGDNRSGQVGDGTRTDRLTPRNVSGLTGAVQIAVAQDGDTTCAVIVDGTVRCWGNNNDGQVGDGTSGEDRLLPTVVSSLTEVVQVSAGTVHTCALLAGGTARCWGRNGSGQLGDGTTSQRLLPTPVLTLSSAVQITAGDNHTCALLGSSYDAGTDTFTSGTARCWGSNLDGKLGDGSTEGRPTPTAVSEMAGAMSITAGTHHTCAVLATRAARCWGSNFGRFGDGSTVGRPTPTAVSSLFDAVQIEAGAEHTCALLASGAARCWGYNNYGRLGDGTEQDRLVSTAVVGLS